MFNRCWRDNSHLKNVDIRMFDNSNVNRPVPVCYNEFLSGWDYSRSAWFAFCHEDFELRGNLSDIVQHLDVGSLYGPIGSVRKGLEGLGYQRILGRIVHGSRDDSRLFPIGVDVPTGTVVDTFDCCCILVHSSLVAQCQLRFDERLEFDLYVEDFCAQAHDIYGVKSRILKMDAIHHSGSVATQRLYRHIPYLGRKYNRCHSAVLVYFGRRPVLMKIQDVIRGLFKRIRRCGRKCGND